MSSIKERKGKSASATAANVNKTRSNYFLRYDKCIKRCVHFYFTQNFQFDIYLTFTCLAVSSLSLQTDSR